MENNAPKVDNRIGINARMQSVNYSYEDMKGINVSNDNTFRCNITKRGMTPNVGQYDVRVIRRSGQMRMVKMEVEFEVQITCAGGDLTKYTDADLERAIKAIVAAKASYLFSMLTNESMRIPMITPPAFENTQK